MFILKENIFRLVNEITAFAVEVLLEQCLAFMQMMVAISVGVYFKPSPLIFGQKSMF